MENRKEFIKSNYFEFHQNFSISTELCFCVFWLLGVKWIISFNSGNHNFIATRIPISDLRGRSCPEAPAGPRSVNPDSQCYYDDDNKYSGYDAQNCQHHGIQIDLTSVSICNNKSKQNCIFLSFKNSGWAKFHL